MKLLRLAAKRAAQRPLGALLNILLIALGVATTSLVLLVSQQAGAMLEKDARGVDLVVGAKGSPLQLILSSVYHLDAPVGNIKRSVVEELGKHPMVRVAAPLALGDNIKGHRIVGTDIAPFLQLYGADIAEGRLAERSMEVVVGRTAAHDLSLEVGSWFSGTHGLSNVGDVHAGSQYQVVGVLSPQGNVLDRLVATPLESVWDVHKEELHDAPEDSEATGGHDDALHEKEITSVLIGYKTPLGAVVLPKMINEMSEAQAASPSLETTRLLSLVGVGIDMLNMFGAVLLCFAGLAVFVGLANGTREARYELAMMRMIGASRTRVAMLILLEASFFAMLGIAIGLLMAHTMTSVLGHFFGGLGAASLTGLAWCEGEWFLVLSALLIAWLGAIVPAMQAARVPVAQVLMER